MTSNNVPNTWISNLAWPPVVVLTTIVTMRLRNSMCKQQPCLRTKFAVDMRTMTLTNLLAVSALVIWAQLLAVPLQNYIAIDLVLSVLCERWLVRVIASFDSTSYHPGGPIGKNMIHQHIRLMCVLATLARGYSASATLVLSDSFTTSPQLPEGTNFALLPLVYTIMRTVALDLDLYQPGASRVHVAEEVSDFVITDEEEEQPPMHDSLPEECQGGM